MQSEQKYKTYKKIKIQKLTNIIRRYKKDYDANILENSKHNVKDMWKILSIIIRNNN